VTVPIIEFTRHYAAHQPALDAAALRVLRSGWYLLGPEVAGFETELAAFLGPGVGGQNVGAVGVANGTDALVLALRALGVGAGDDVLCPAMTATATPMAIRLAGATPIFVDVLPETLCMDPDDARRKLTAQAKAVVPVHLYGRAADLNPLLALGPPVLEDCAQAAGALYHDQRVGTLGAATAFSFYPTKNLGALGDAGAVVSKDPELLERVRLLRSYGEKERYHASEEGMNSRLDELQAAFLRVKLPYLEATNQRRREIAWKYSQNLDPAIVTVPPDEPGHVYHLYVVRSDFRNALRKHLTERGVGTTIHYPVAQHRQEAFASLGQGESCPVATREAERILSLPLFPELTDEEINYVIDAVNSYARP
jgi:dTDP-4-amino-4,6-dideoxygalactose transaminase